MTIIVIIVLILAVVFGPSLWVKRVLEKYSLPADRYAGTGAQLARHLLNKHGLEDVAVERTPEGDHYDPQAKAVRLTDDKFDGKSLTAITVAAHEVDQCVETRGVFQLPQCERQLIPDSDFRVVDKREKLLAHSRRICKHSLGQPHGVLAYSWMPVRQTRKDHVFG